MLARWLGKNEETES